MHGHLDVVPADPRNWTVDPFGGVIKDGMLWGRGAVDMKNMDAMILDRARRHPGRGASSRRATWSSPSSPTRRTAAVAARTTSSNNHPELFAGATEAISEVGGYSIDLDGRRAYLLQTGEKSLVWIKLIARGRAAHGSRLIRDNAITQARRGRRRDRPTRSGRSS